MHAFSWGVVVALGVGAVGFGAPGAGLRARAQPAAHLGRTAPIASRGADGRLGGVQQPMPVRQLGPIISQAHDTLGYGVGWIRVLTDGQVLVDDWLNRRVLLFDSTLTHSVVVANASGSMSTAFGNGAGTPGLLIPYLADTTLFLDQAALSLVFIDPTGKIGRVIAAPDAKTPGSLFAGQPGVDALGRLVYRSMTRPVGRPATAPRPDTVPIVRVDLRDGHTDTLAFIKIHVPRFSQPVTVPGRGARVAPTIAEPFYTVDDWAMLSDGTVAIVRGHDLHVDFVGTDGGRESGPRIPFAWQPVNDSLKQWLVDSVGRADSVFRSTLPATSPQNIPRDVVAAGDVPDYRPAFVAPFARGDAEGNLWIKEYSAGVRTDGAIYLVVNRHGFLIDHVQIPGGTSLAGFGPGGIVYLTSAIGNGIEALARARLR